MSTKIGKFMLYFYVIGLVASSVGISITNNVTFYEYQMTPSFSIDYIINIFKIIFKLVTFQIVGIPPIIYILIIAYPILSIVLMILTALRKTIRGA